MGNLIIHGQLLFTQQSKTNTLVRVFNQDSLNDNFLIYTNELAQANNIRVAKQIHELNSEGKILKSYLLDSSESIFAIRPIKGYYYLTVSRYINDSTFHAIIKKCDKNFNVVNEKKLYMPKNTFPSFVNFCEMGGNIFVALNKEQVFSHGNGDTSMLYRLDLNLNLKDSVGKSNYLLDLNSNDTCLIYSQVNLIGYNPVEVHKITKNFNHLKTFTLDSIFLILQNSSVKCYQYGTLLNLDQDKFAVVSNANCPLDYGASALTAIFSNNKCVNAIKVGSPNQKYSSHTQGSPNSTFRFGSIYNVLYCDREMYFVPPKIHNYFNVHKIDTAGNLIWSKYFGGDRWYRPTGIYAANDSGVVVSGMRYDTLNPAVVGAAEGFIMKIDKDGNQVMVNVIEIQKKITSRVYPNPATSEIYIELADDAKYELKIYDTQGKEVMTVQQFTRTKKLAVSHLTKGVYVYTLKSNEKFGSGKFVKE